MAKQIKESNLASRRNKELAILKAQNELLESAKQNVVDHFKKSPETAESLIKQIDEAKDENIMKGQAYYGAPLSEIESSVYGKATEAGIEEYKEHLRKRGITDESKLYKKNIEEEVNYAKVAEYGENAVGNEEDMHLDGIEMPTLDGDNYDIGGGYEYGQPTNVQASAREDNAIPSNIQYDILPLPSNGECYRHKKNRVTVGYLTASDENVITSSNLYRDGKVLDILLKRKVLDKDINPDDLVSGDRDMILLWLRATGYGVEFPIKVRDPQTGTVFDSLVDLSKVKTKDFSLKGDENGWFDFITKGGDVLKFKYLTHREEMSLVRNSDLVARAYKKAKLIDILRDLTDELDDDKTLSDGNRGKLERSINLFREWCDGIKTDVKDEDSVDSTLTEMMIAETMSVNGNGSREFVREYIQNMKAMDARQYRLFIQKNQPGMDMAITVNRPESLGGGSFETFLTLDSFLFLSVSDV